MAEKGETLSDQFPNSFMVWSLLSAANKGWESLKRPEIHLRGWLSSTGYADGFNNLAVVLQEQGDVFNAAKAYQKAIPLSLIILKLITTEKFGIKHAKRRDCVL